MSTIKKTPRKRAEPALTIREVHDFNAKVAAREVLEFGFTLIDDISEVLVDVTKDELMDELSHAADEMDIRTNRVETGWGPVFIFRDHSRVTLAVAKKFVFAQRSKP
jgi:hypothetical protein